MTLISTEDFLDERTSRKVDPVDRAVGVNVRQLRFARGVTQDALGAALGMSFQQIQKYESGQNRIGAGRLFKIAIALDCSVEDFFNGIDKRVAKVEPVPHPFANLTALETRHALDFRSIKCPARRQIVVDLTRVLSAEEGRE